MAEKGLPDFLPSWMISSYEHPIPISSLVLKTWRRVCIPSGFCPTLHHLSALVDTDYLLSLSIIFKKRTVKPLFLDRSQSDIPHLQRCSPTWGCLACLRHLYFWQRGDFLGPIPCRSRANPALIPTFVTICGHEIAPPRKNGLGFISR